VTDFLFDPFHLAFMRRALVELFLLSALGSTVGVHVLLRRRAFLTEALQHSVFPGIAIAFVLGQSLMVGALVTAILTVVVLAFVARRPGVDPDAAMALLIAGFFAIGVVVVSRRSGYQADLTSLLFGRILDVDARQILDTVVVVGASLGLLFALHKELVLRALDPVQAAAVGYRVAVLDLVLDAVVALVVVIAVRALGTVLVVAFVVTPPAAARLVARSVSSTMALAVVLASVFSWIGLCVSYEASVHHGVRLAAGATVVVSLTAGFLLVGIAALARRVGSSAAARRRLPAVEPATAR
jgi:manganese/iron transport system permease protein